MVVVRMPDRPTAEGLLRERGLRVTPQRQSVLEFLLEGSGRHWTADQLRSHLLPAMPGLARGTTYKVLDELVRAHLCEEMATEQGVSIYGMRLVPHHHFVCSVCHNWFDVDAEGIPGLNLRGLPDAVVDEVKVIFEGRCPVCRTP